MFLNSPKYNISVLGRFFLAASFLVIFGCSGPYPGTISSKLNCRNDASAELVFTVSASRGLPKDYVVPAGASRKFLHVGKETGVSYTQAEYSIKIIVSDQNGKQRGFYSKSADTGDESDENKIVFPDGKKGLREFDIVCNDTSCTLNGQAITPAS